MKFFILSLMATLTFMGTSTFAYHGPGHHHPRPSTRLSIYELSFSFTGPGCFLRAPHGFAPPFAWPILNSGGVLVHTTQGMRIMTGFDPIRLAPHLYRHVRNDMVVATPHGLALYPRYSLVPYGFVEVFQTPLEAGLCYY